MQSENKNSVRRRGVTLTIQGSRKINQAKAEIEIEQNFKRYTLESLSEATGLTPTTISKVFTGSARVDKRTLQYCFDAFNLTLLANDYQYNSDRDNLAEMSFSTSAENFSNLEAVRDSPLETLRDRTNTPQTSQMAQSPRPPTVPGGQMPLDSVFYIDRPILESLCYQAIVQPGTLLNIRAPKQMGKTSLMSRILAYGSSLGYQTVSLNLQLADAEILQNLERFLKWFCARVSKQLGLLNQTADFWDNSLGSKANATDCFEDIILGNCVRATSPKENCPLVIAIDELNQLFAYPDIAREFLLLLRTWSEKAKIKLTNSNLWQKLRLVAVFSTEVLIPSAINPSLLNTGLVIDLPEFTQAQVQDLAKRYEQEITAQQIEQLITLLGGHPYRVQLAFYSLYQQTITLEELLENSGSTTALYKEHLKQQWWNLQRYPELLTIFTEIVSQSSPVECEAKQASQLYKMGLVHHQGMQASLACELFRPFFCNRLSPIKNQ
ncbi:AAA-like domain-containing protein [Lyngbya sp. PCC 8106]|uniref:AAA-like domain-containing protein n=1 Tax=Lyngbya sp. (strain PCC 8106) TaxID=313612 RepID=UPI0000EACC37|nr:AAA-like domain-containing protein [Lyngbya sp. PCC 8106]EAW37852.1 serine/threonine protein kinase [Lyngbya sp. PCC 8106]